MRLQKFLRDKNIASLRKSDELIQSKLVSINGEKLTDPTYYLKNGDVVGIFGKDYLYEEKNEEHHSYLFHKPINVLCSHSDPSKRKLVFDFFKKEACLKNRTFFYGGRLDYNSRGLMILSTDGQFIQKITHPSGGYAKHYLVKSKNPLNIRKLEDLSRGTKEYKPFRFSLVDRFNVRIILNEGKKREIRELFSMMNNTVVDLFREQIGPYTIGNLKAGEYKEIDEK